MNYNNTNIRYHIFKELLKHRRQINKTNLDRINDFAIPVFSGISTALLSKVTEEEFINPVGPIYRILFYLIIPALIYFFIYNVSRCIITVYKDKILPYLKQTKTSATNRTEEEKERTAKFDYEVSNLVQFSYVLITEKVEDKILADYNLMLSIFYATNAIKDLEKSLLPDKIHVSTNRINFILYTLKECVNLQQKRENNELFNAEILNAVSSYNTLVEELNKVYNLNIAKIEKAS